MHNYIKSQDELTSAIDQMKLYQSLAIDTEFFWEKTYYPILGIIQIATEDGVVFIIDAVTITDLKPLGEIFANPKIMKILHDSQQDLYIIRRATCADPKNIFDTRAACGFAGLKSTISLANMLLELINVDLPKTESRSDWLRRPLNEKQLLYAENDVLYLHKAYNLISDKAKELNLYDYMMEDMQSLDNDTLYKDRVGSEQYRKLKGYGNFTQSQLVLLQDLAEWRDKLAKHKDIPKNWLLKDKEILSIAKLLPQNISDFNKVSFDSYKFINRNQSIIIDKVTKALNTKGTNLLGLEMKVPPNIKNKTDIILEKIKIKSSEIFIDAALFGSRKDISNYLLGNSNDKLQLSWRKEFLKPMLEITNK